MLQNSDRFLRCGVLHCREELNASELQWSEETEIRSRATDAATRGALVTWSSIDLGFRKETIVTASRPQASWTQCNEKSVKVVRVSSKWPNVSIIHNRRDGSN